MKIIICMGTAILLGGALYAVPYHPPQHQSNVQDHPPQHPSNVQEHAIDQDLSHVSVKITDHPKLGKILTDANGRTLYTFSSDKNDTSTCYDQCAVTWPPFIISSGKPTLPAGVSGTLDVIHRRDGSAQATYNGMPLYYYADDKNPGDVNGQNKDNKWFVIRPL